MLIKTFLLMETERQIIQTTSQPDKDRRLQHLQSLQELRAKLLVDYQAKKQCILDELLKVDTDINATKRSFTDLQS